MLAVLGDLRASTAPRIPFIALGFPKHKEQPKPGGGAIRESDEVEGEIPWRRTSKASPERERVPGWPLARLRRIAAVGAGIRQRACRQHRSAALARGGQAPRLSMRLPAGGTAADGPRAQHHRRSLGP
ncbi:hypothetical protein T261_08351 [Streptomyces lydicus]|nr:hypothetical protein T261_08351 [Streptomyces lydicus]